MTLLRVLWCGGMMVPTALLAQAVAPAPAGEQPLYPNPLTLLGESNGGRQISVDPASLKTLPALRGMRDFPVAQLFVEMRGPGTKGSIERVRYSFNCRSRTVAALAYVRFAGGKKSHDWQGADNAIKYERVSAGTLVDMAMTYACSGGKLPKRPIRPVLPNGDPTNGDEEGG